MAGKGMGDHIQNALKASYGASLLGEDDGLSTPASPAEALADLDATNSDDAIQAKQQAALKTYIDSVPYVCETPEEMERILAGIVGKMYIAVKSNRVKIMRELDAALSTWIALKYPLSKSTRIKLLKFYYELCMIPSERHLINERVSMFFALLPHKRDSIMTLDADDLVLDWRPLWRIIKKELWPLKRLIDSTKNVADIYINLAEPCKRFFPASEIKPILDTFLPLLSPTTHLSIIPVLASFIPLTQPEQYLPAVFAIWKAFNSKLVDERFTELLGCLAEEHVLGIKDGDVLHWNDVGVFTKEQWTFLMGKLIATLDEWTSGSKGKNSPANQADAASVKNGARVKKAVNRQYEFAKLIVYSMSVDGPFKVGSGTEPGLPGGSTALDSLEKVLISRETLFHPSNSGTWTFGFSDLIWQLSSEFCRRWKEEEDPKCKTPMMQRLNRRIRRSFVTILRTPLLLLLFAKDPLSTSLAQAALRKLAFLEPDVIMPQLLERAYNGLEIINETHRTTAALGMLASVALPLVSRKVWRGGQKHLVPLLELCLPGIDLNDPSKTICTTNFIQSVVQHIKIGDLSMHASYSGALITDDGPSGSMEMDVDEEAIAMPEGVEGFERLSRKEEWTLARESTAGFADWVTSLFRRIFSLYENLPEEGGRRNTTGGKAEESMLKAIKNMLDVVCLHLSTHLFDLTLKIVHEYATTNTRANAVRAISQMIACLARTDPQKTTDRFLPHCIETIKEELKHGASSVPTTSSHTALPSDTTLHWNISVLRGCLGYGGPTLLKHKSSLIDLVKVLIEKTKGERGYTGTGRLLLRLLSTLSGVYPLNSRFVNASEWTSEEFENNHMKEWGRFYEASQVKIEWHEPNDDEIGFVLEIMDNVIAPLIEKLGGLLTTIETWGSTERNDFCRFLNAVRSAWQGLPTLLKEVLTQEARSADGDLDIPELLPSKLGLNAGFALSDPEDTRYKALKAHREAFGKIAARAVDILGSNGGKDDHIDAVVLVLKAIDVYMLEYATSKAGFTSLRKNYTLARDITRMWPRQKQSTRLVFLKRAQVYHNARLSTHSVYRQRDAIGMKLTDHLVELSLSPYTRVRRSAQGILEAVAQSYPSTSRSVILRMLSNLKRGTDPDRMKGALYTLSSNSSRLTLRYDPELQVTFMNALLECQHQEKPSIQKIIPTVHHDFLLQCISEETLRRPTSIDCPKDFESSLTDLCNHFNIVHNVRLLSEAKDKSGRQYDLYDSSYEKMVTSVVGISRRPSTHWRYLHMALQYLIVTLRRDVPPNSEIASLLLEKTTTPHVTTRSLALKGLVKLLAFVKIRSYSKTDEELWFEEWKSPFRTDLNISDAQRIKAFIQAPFIEGQDLSGTPFIDKVTSGFLAWQPTLKAYAPPQRESRIDAIWDPGSRPALQIIREKLQDTTCFRDCLNLWAQESDTIGAMSTDLSLRIDIIFFIKSLAKHYESECLGGLLPLMEPMIIDPDRFKQRAAAEALSGLLRGSKHWSLTNLDTLWDWFMSRVDVIFNQIRPDTVAFWDSLFRHIIAERDPRRSKPLIDKILSRPIDFKSDSAFQVTKSLDNFLAVAEESLFRFGGVASHYIGFLFQNSDTDFAEIRSIIAQSISILMYCEWFPSYDSVDAFLNACRSEPDPFKIRQGLHADIVTAIAQKLPGWKEERLPPPKTNQSQFDKVALTILMWMWSVGHTVEAGLIFPYILPMLPDILKMTDLDDNADLVTHSSSVLFLLSSISVPEHVEEIADKLAETLRTSQSWKMKRTGLVLMTVYLLRYMLSLSQECMERSMNIVISCLYDENLEVSETAAKLLASMLRSSQRHKILPLRDRFVAEVRGARLPRRQDPEYTTKLRALHAGILGVRALIESFPYTIEPWLPPLTEVLSPHASDPPPISSTIRKCASEFKKTHQDTWHLDERAFTPEQLQDLSTMLIGTSYYA